MNTQASAAQFFVKKNSNSGMGVFLPDIKTYYNASMTKIIWHWYINKQWNTIEKS